MKINFAYKRKNEIEKDTWVRNWPKTGRNEKCPCESGKKFKHCCIDTVITALEDV